MISQIRRKFPPLPIEAKYNRLVGNERIRHEKKQATGRAQTEVSAVSATPSSNERVLVSPPQIVKKNKDSTANPVITPTTTRSDTGLESSRCRKDTKAKKRSGRTEALASSNDPRNNSKRRRHDRQGKALASVSTKDRISDLLPRLDELCATSRRTKQAGRWFKEDFQRPIGPEGDFDRGNDKKDPGLGSSSAGSLLPLLGTGTFGEVFLAQCKASRQLVALKQFSFRKPRDVITSFHLLVREIRIHRLCRHANIISFLGYFHNNVDSASLVLEYAPHGMLSDYLSSQQQSINSGAVVGRNSFVHRIASFARQILSALQHLHKHNIFHRDVKSDNILMVSEAEVKLGDFGWAVRIRRPTPPETGGDTSTDPTHVFLRMTLCGTPEFVPPEMIIANRKRDEAEARDSNKSSSSRFYDVRFVDAWSFGVMVHDLVFGRTPFHIRKRQLKAIAKSRGHDKEYEAIFDLIAVFQSLSKESTEAKSIAASFKRPSLGGHSCPGGISSTSGNAVTPVGDFLSRLIVRDPSDRMTLQEALEHDWLNGPEKVGGSM